MAIVSYDINTNGQYYYCEMDITDREAQLLETFSDEQAIEWIDIQVENGRAERVMNSVDSTFDDTNPPDGIIAYYGVEYDEIEQWAEDYAQEELA